ncbi:MAG: metal ABC transporter substrate-binding protein [Gemmatimonadota bacterium]|jgi:zinc transport system substrate-binding protein
MRRKRGVLATYALLSILILGCAGAEEDEMDQRPVVVTSIFPLGDLVQELVGSEVRVETVLPPGASPATFSVTPRQLQDYREASLFIMVGGGLDEWLSRIPEASGGESSILELAEGIHLLEAGEEPSEEGADHGHGTGNPHIWLDPILVRDEILPRLLEALVSVLPSSSADIEARGAALADSLSALDAEIRRELAPLRQRAFITTHSAWPYFAARYEMEEAGVIHAHPGHEPSSREIAALLAVAERHGIPCLFTEPQLGEVAARALATEMKLPTLELDPLGGPNVLGREGYFELLRFNTAQLLAGLGG